MAENNYSVLVGQEFGKGSLRVSYGCSPKLVGAASSESSLGTTPHSSPAWWVANIGCQLGGLLGAQPEHLLVSSPVWHYEGSRTFSITAGHPQIKRPRKTRQKFLWPSLMWPWKLTWKSGSILPCSLLVQAVISPPDAWRYRPHLLMRRVSKSFGTMFYNCHSGFFNFCILFHSLQIVLMSAHKLEYTQALYIVGVQ